MYNYLSEPVGPYINVTDFGAKGNGATDDAAAIQSAIDYIKESGGVIVFPPGTYLIKTNIIFYSRQTLFFQGATLLRGDSAVNNLLMSYCASGTTGYNGTHDSAIIGALFDGGSFSTSITLAGIIHAKNIVFQRCTFRNSYGTYHDMEINSSYNCKVIDCDFEGSQKTIQNACMMQIDAINNAATWPWDNNRGSVDNTVSKYIEIVGCIFHDDKVSPAIGNHSTATDTHINIHDCIFDGLIGSRGAINFQSASDVDIANNTFNGCTTCVGSDAATYFIHGNHITGATTICGENAAAHCNLVDGIYVT